MKRLLIWLASIVAVSAAFYLRLMASYLMFPRNDQLALAGATLAATAVIIALMAWRYSTVRMHTKRA